MHPVTLSDDELAVLIGYLARLEPPQRPPRDSSWLDTLESAAHKIEDAYLSAH